MTGSLFFVLNFVLVTMLTSVTQAAPKDIYFRQFKEQRFEKFQSRVTKSFFTQKLNHDDPNDKRTFQQRFYVDTSWALNSESPTILYICGEATCSMGEVESGEVSSVASRLHANIVGLEHRYYGESKPFTTYETENLKYLSSRAALADLDTFQKWATQQYNMRGKWIAVGGSYAGSLSAYYRTLYPQNVVGASASSAPVFVKADFEEYDRHVTGQVGENCAAKMRQAIATVESMLKDPTQNKKVKELFEASTLEDDVDFLYVLADMSAAAAQYGDTYIFCSYLEEGSDPVEDYARAGKRIFDQYNWTAAKDSYTSALSVQTDSGSNYEGRAWLYQTCTEFGYFQIANHDPTKSVRSSRIDLQYNEYLCKVLFGIDKPVDTTATNAYYYQNILASKTSNIFFTNGTSDPWSELSISDVNGNATNPNLTLMMIPNGYHCEDMNGAGSPEVVAATDKLFELAQEWLK